ncbi:MULTISPECIES: DUF6231 family protein [unclassified Marinimicrobium]|jgi:hypothetical protein|uniref:DUF6231 family protein n=2 Tax=Marinimicrobium TaxID=359337 RepID=UPI00257C38B8|nr:MULTISPECIES: DUF6231 family protein [unclassified Marinimicrobium]|tara:strand:+ start:106 stop:585 length:480 start_codon:yes stop_codon:yes gene_type:complete
MKTSTQAIAALVDACEPDSIVAVGEQAQAIAQRWHDTHGQCQLTCLDAADTEQGLSLPRTQDLALVTGSLEHLSHSAGQTLIGQLRNYGTRQIGVLVTDGAGWSLTDFIGLGFRRQARIEEEGHNQTLYTYNISNYNHKRDWNNPRFWANPEMWGKAWW